MGSESKSKGEVMQIPAASKKVVQNIKEIVSQSCTDAEIYSVLCECNMDADAAVQNLLTQDSFHQVKSKRERRKEMKETQELMARGNNNGYRGVKSGGECNGGRVPCQISDNDLGKAAYRKENGSVAPSGPSSTLRYPVKMTYEQPSSNNSDSCNADDRRQAKATGTGDAISSFAQLSSGTQAAWSGGTTRHVSMADIVRMGRLHSKGSQNITETSYTPQDVVGSLNSSQYCHKSSCESSPCPPEMHQGLRCPHPSQAPETIHKFGVIANSHDEWPVFEQQTAAGGSCNFSVSNASSTERFSNQSYFYGDGTNSNEDRQLEEVQVSKRDATNINPGSYCAESAFSCRRQENMNAAVCDSRRGDCLQKDKTCNSWSCMKDHQEGTEIGFHLPFPNCAAPLNDEVSSAAVNLPQLSLGKEEPALPPSEDNHAVVFPDNMQAFATDWSHLRFGTYKNGAYNAVSGLLASSPVKTKLEEASAAANASSALCREIRNPEYLDEYLRDEQLRSMSDTHQLTTGVGINNMHVYSQQELRRENTHEVSHGHKYTHPTSVPDSNFKKTQELDFPLSVRIHPKARNLSSLHMELQASATTIPMDMFVSTIQSSRDSDYAKSSFLGTQLMSSRFGSTLSSTGTPAMSQSEILSPSAFSLPVSYLPTQPGANPAPQPTLPQHLSANLYSQPTVSLEELTNLNSYPAMQQNYARNPSAFQQAYQDNTVFLDSLSNMGYGYPQYKTGASRSNLPLSDVNISGYRGFGITANFPGAILQAAAPTGSAGGYDIFHSQYQERNNITIHQQNDGSSRMMPALPDNGYFSLTGQSQLLSGYPQDQQQCLQDHRSRLLTHTYEQDRQLLQDYGAPFHANVHHSQAEIRPEQLRQSLSDLSFSSQRPAPSNYNSSGSGATNGSRLPSN